MIQNCFINILKSIKEIVSLIYRNQIQEKRIIDKAVYEAYIHASMCAEFLHPLVQSQSITITTLFFPICLPISFPSTFSKSNYRRSFSHNK
jgi:hypothetical protein